MGDLSLVTATAIRPVANSIPHRIRSSIGVTWQSPPLVEAQPRHHGWPARSPFSGTAKIGLARPLVGAVLTLLPKPFL